MTAHDPSLGRNSGLLGWLGFGTNRTAPPPDIPSSQPREPRRLRQLEDVAAFLGYHRLEVNAHTLTAAWNYLSGSDANLIRLIDQRLHERQPLTADWLDEVTNEGNSDAAQLAELMERVASSIVQLAKTSNDARRATSEYNSALEGHLDELAQANQSGTVLSDLARIAKVMLKRTRKIEEQMRRSEAETRALQKRLDDARRRAEEDELTGLPNRRAFEACYEEEYRRAFAAVEPLCVVFCDIDHFKRINDTHGHDAGDRVLRAVAESLAQVSGDRCHVARHGGEEFVLLFSNTPLTEAFARLDRLREQLADRRMVNRATDQPFGQITFSAGIADVFAFADRRTALRAADAALYRAKQAGRNRIMIAGPDDAVVAELHAA